ncbi:MAG: hypothetical protein ACN4GM_02870 [Gammaproteobacteria bacterium]
MKIFPHRVTLALILVLSGLSVSVEAEQKSLKAIIPWEGEGRVFQVAPDTLQFLGAFDGIMYVETAKGKLDQGFVRCPVSQKVELETKKTSATGSCMITSSSDDTVFAEWTCVGRVGSCTGEFKLTGGTGRFEGITGTSKFIVRSPLHALVAGMSGGNMIRVASGLALLPELKYKIPSKN